ncbi:carboxymuconolactone decarboxylase family protein [Candidatus Stoquefichus massiliensis]|uniref:carboxymuconolactone decarboxylase family protein n=1 Tax=Candidatus Stoquefichus massiliensis TaxID=1470350 RepID=UPI00048A24CC|nr:carboxymuconolactone decarboxylase family protein [Candidatus Stoquefichus massiliensis]
MDRKTKANNLYQKLYGQQDENKYDQEYHDIMKNYIYGDVYQHGNLDEQLRELILIVVSTTNHTLKVLKKHIHAGIHVNLSPIMMKEAIYQCTPYIGYGKVDEALVVLNKVLENENIDTHLPSQSTVKEDTRFQSGFDVQSAAFGKEHIQSGHDNAPKELKHIQNYLSEYCFGDFYTRNGLDLKTRELLTFIMLATLGGCENQLKAHTQANITVGNTRQLLIDTITQCQPYIGFPRTLNAIAIINEITQ